MSKELETYQSAQQLQLSTKLVVEKIGHTALLTLNNPPGQRHLSVGIGSDLVFTLFFAGLVWLMAAVIAQGQTLAEENEGFV